MLAAGCLLVYNVNAAEVFCLGHQRYFGMSQIWRLVARTSSQLCSCGNGTNVLVTALFVRSVDQCSRHSSVLAAAGVSVRIFIACWAAWLDGVVTCIDLAFAFARVMSVAWRLRSVGLVRLRGDCVLSDLGRLRGDCGRSDRCRLRGV